MRQSNKKGRLLRLLLLFRNLTVFTKKKDAYFYTSIAHLFTISRRTKTSPRNTPTLVHSAQTNRLRTLSESASWFRGTELQRKTHFSNTTGCSAPEANELLVGLPSNLCYRPSIRWGISEYSHILSGCFFFFSIREYWVIFVAKLQTEGFRTRCVCPLGFPAELSHFAIWFSCVCW